MQQPQVFKLSMYLKSGQELLQIDEKIDANKAKLVKEATERKQLNKDYVAIILTYSLKEANLIV